MMGELGDWGYFFLLFGCIVAACLLSPPVKKQIKQYRWFRKGYESGHDEGYRKGLVDGMKIGEWNARKKRHIDAKI